ncbi:hypothetical protein [Paraburkholderia rhynchosiae]|uniref:Uncharacterized protein n=1 Tax=Paraburkholderia rhynchosiae TaxID=487049 RepID=A0A2N7WLM2_9BURK|nr:hypothetical protein [Paraburkholderia rhynchosiae]PMS30318.1 hypothetical protein C0Z16_15330 [Paraburkholderia rhynchosiae]CAB3691128.1 hypothetical protein LMG27174_03174 [Paraburkholderia rhynchosiae]
MEDNDYLAAFALCVTVDAIRKAQGKMMPEDLPIGSMERMLAEVDVIQDTLRMLGIVPDAMKGLQDGAEE